MKPLSVGAAVLRGGKPAGGVEPMADWIAEPTLHLEDAANAMCDSADGALSADDEATLMVLLERMVDSIGRRRTIDGPPDETRDFLRRALRHVVRLFSAVATRSPPYPTPPTLDAAARLLESLFEPTRELYLFAFSEYTASDSMASEMARASLL